MDVWKLPPVKSYTAPSMQTPKLPDSDFSTRAVVRSNSDIGVLVLPKEQSSYFHNKLGELFLYGAGHMDGDIIMLKQEQDKNTKVESFPNLKYHCILWYWDFPSMELNPNHEKKSQAKVHKSMCPN